MSIEEILADEFVGCDNEDVLMLEDNVDVESICGCDTEHVYEATNYSLEEAANLDEEAYYI